MKPDEYERDVAPLTLAYHASTWVDMDQHIGTLAGLARDAQTVLELGVRGAVSTWALLDGLPPDGLLYSIDAVDVVREGIVPRKVRDDPRWHFLCGDDLDVNVLSEIPRTVDLVFIDTSHEYHHTLAELVLAARLGASVIALHDYHTSDVQDAIHGFVRRDARWTLTVEQSQWGLAVLQ